MVHALPDVVLAGTTKQALTATAQRAAWVQVFSKTGNTAGKIGGAEVTSTQGAPIVASTGNNTPVYFPPCGNTDTYDLSAIYILGTTSDVYYVLYGTV